MFKYDSSIKFDEPYLPPQHGTSIEDSSTKNLEDLPYVAENESSSFDG